MRVRLTGNRLGTGRVEFNHMARRELDEWFWQVGDEFRLLSKEMREPSRPVPGRRFWQPKVDVFEDEGGNIVLRSELAGVQGEDVQLAYLPERNCLVIRGVRREEELPSGARVCCHQLEIFYGEFERCIELPMQAEPRGIRASFRNGYLLVVIPTVQQSPQTRLRRSRSY